MDYLLERFLRIEYEDLISSGIESNFMGSSEP
jgi:hypothetical protein